MGDLLGRVARQPLLLEDERELRDLALGLGPRSPRPSSAISATYSPSSASLARYEPPPIAIGAGDRLREAGDEDRDRPGFAAAIPVTTPSGTSRPSWAPSTNSRMRESARDPRGLAERVVGDVLLGLGAKFRPAHRRSSSAARSAAGSVIGARQAKRSQR